MKGIMRNTNVVNMEALQLKCIEISCSKGFHKNSSAVFKIRSMWPNFELIRDFIVLYLHTKFYQIPSKNECVRVFTRKMLTDRRTDRQTDGRTPDNAPWHKLIWPMASRAKNKYPEVALYTKSKLFPNWLNPEKISKKQRSDWKTAHFNVNWLSPI